MLAQLEQILPDVGTTITNLTRRSHTENKSYQTVAQLEQIITDFGTSTTDRN